MGCSQSYEMPLQKANMKRTQCMDFSITDASFRSEIPTISDQDESVSCKPQQKLALRTLLRYGSLTVFRSLYCSFKYWKKHCQVSLPIYSPINYFLISTSEFPPLTKPKVDIFYTEQAICNSSSAENLEKSIEVIEQSVSDISNLSFAIHEANNYYAFIKPCIEIDTYTVTKMETRIHGRPSPQEVKLVENECRNKSEINNPMLIEIAVKTNNIVPYPLKSTLKLFEDLMDKKYALDCKEMKEFRKPRELSEFFIDFMNRSFGIQSVAQKTLNRVLITLEYNQKHSYLDLFCRLLKIYTPHPISLNMLAYICKVRCEFNQLIGKYANRITQMRVKYENSNFENKEFGGSASLIDVFEWITQNFKVPLVKKQVFQSLSISSLQPHEYLIFYSCYKASKAGAPIILSIQNRSKSEILQSLLSFIDFPITSPQRGGLENYISEQTIKKLSTSLSISIFNENTLKPKYTINKCEFLNSLPETYSLLKSHSIDQFISE